MADSACSTKMGAENVGAAWKTTRQFAARLPSCSRFARRGDSSALLQPAAVDFYPLLLFRILQRCFRDCAGRRVLESSFVLLATRRTKDTCTDDVRQGNEF